MKGKYNYLSLTLFTKSFWKPSLSGGSSAALRMTHSKTHRSERASQCSLLAKSCISLQTPSPTHLSSHFSPAFTDFIFPRASDSYRDQSTWHRHMASCIGGGSLVRITAEWKGREIWCQQTGLWSRSSSYVLSILHLSEPQFLLLYRGNNAPVLLPEIR